MKRYRNLHLIFHFALLLGTGIFFIYLSKNILGNHLSLLEDLKKETIIESLLVIMPIWLVVIYLLCISWKNCLQCSTKKELKFNFICQIYIKSNLAKYLPGGILNFFARGFLGKKEITKNDIALSSALEVTLSILSNFIFIAMSTIILLKTDFNIFPDLLSVFLKKNKMEFFLFASLILFALLVVGILVAKKKKYPIIFGEWNNLLNKKQNILTIFFCNFMIFILEGFCFYILLHINHASNSSDFLFIATCLGISSALGFIIPFVPAGLGIKEASLLLLLNKFYPFSSILISAILMRLGVLMIEFMLYYLIELKLIHK